MSADLEKATHTRRKKTAKDMYFEGLLATYDKAKEEDNGQADDKEEIGVTEFRVRSPGPESLPHP